MWLYILLLGGIPLVVSFINFLVSKIFYKTEIKIYWRELLIGILLFYIASLSTIFISIFLIPTILEKSTTNLMVFSLILAPIIYAPILTWDFILLPLVHIFFSKKKISQEYGAIAASYGIKAKVIVAEKMKNACSTGLLGKSKTIIIGEELITQMSEDEVKGILCHEIAHQKLGHMWFLLLLNVIHLYIFIFLMRMALFFDNPYIGVAIMGGLGGGLLPVLMMLMRPKEKEADIFAANAVGTEVFISALNKLNTMNKERMEKFDFEHPRLSERIAHIRKHCSTPKA